MPDASDEIAIIGFAGRFPGANSVDAFWRNLRDGLESISYFSHQDLISSGMEPALVKRDNYVGARGVIEGADLFDASFFNFTPREAEITDPQHRVLLECAWEALESAGYVPEKYPGLIGVYAGTAMSTYLLNLYSRAELIEAVGGFQIGIGNDKDHLPTTISYKLNLKGPSVTVQTSCSTSLVAVHIACQSLLNGECDIALAGGVTIKVPQQSGYVYREGGITSPNGQCRAFDEQAAGTVSGNGAGIVVLKRLANAVADRDCVHAVIKGSAINNDGSLKVGYTAPSVQGQAAVIADALNIAGVNPETISYVEAHGTGTSLGDPVEIAALTQAFRSLTAEKGFCAIGSVKTNIGHLDTAAGVAGLIKTALALEHKMLPPSLHFTKPNPKIDFANSPFYVNDQLREWPANGTPRRAGVSSFGIGGTNAHLVLEEAQPSDWAEAVRPVHLLTLSAKTSTALERMTANLASFLKQHPNLYLADVAYTLQVGRSGFNCRRAILCRDIGEAVDGLETADPRRVFTHSQVERKRQPIVFMFAGQGTQYLRMGAQLYEQEETFRLEVNRCSDFLQPILGLDLRELLYQEEAADESARLLNETWLTQPALFVIEYALAQLWMQWGARPQAMIGHSIGEYVAACVAGTMSLEEALGLVAVRGRLMQEIVGGAMLAVGLSEQETEGLLGARLSLAAVNAPLQSVVSGPESEVSALEADLRTRKVECHRLPTSHAFHSAMMEPIVDRFTQAVKKVRLKPPAIPYISNVTGSWIRDTEATNPGYWARHLRQTVRFAKGMQSVLKAGEWVLLEIGPGQTLCGLARAQNTQVAGHLTISTLRSAGQRGSDQEHLTRALGKLWLAGAEIDWQAYYGREQRRRVALPTYPFERLRYWIDPPGKQLKAAEASNQNNGAKQDSSLWQATENPAVRENEFMSATKVSSTNKTERYGKILSDLKIIINALTGLEPAQLDDYATYFDMGVSSLLLIQAVSAVRDKFGVQVTLVQLFDEFPTLDALATHLDQQLLPEELPPLAASIEPTPRAIPIASPSQRPPSPFASIDAASPKPLIDHENITASQSAVQHILSQQLELMSKQIDLLRNGHSIGEASPSLLTAAELSPVNRPPEDINSTVRIRSAVAGPVLDVGNGSSIDVAPEAFVPFRPSEVGPMEGLSPRQQEHLTALMERYTLRTQESKRLTQVYRPFLADPRSSGGFRRLWKEMLYPIIAQRSAGSKLWDVDDNQYVDLTMGFGVHLFGHSPGFVREALEEQLIKGVQLGPQSYMAGQVAELICELTGVERAAFCNSGTEAVMSALRVARAVTGRAKIAIFAGSYHGSFDGVLARGVIASGVRRSVPMALGITKGMVEDVLVLEYGTDESLEMLKANSHQLAAVMVEPVQSRRPDFQPKEFLQEVRQLTERTGAALIFDEVVSGFRVHPGGCQALFEVQADLVTYGKVVGGGLPIGVVAGRAAYMDALDGGQWKFGDASFPQVSKTFFAGTFWKHPLALAAAHAVLTHLKTEGPGLQEQLNRRTTKLVATLNDHFERENVSFKAHSFGSLMSFVLPPELKYADLFSYHLVEKGVYVWEGSTRFLSTAHTDDDVACVIHAIKQSIAELQDGGFISNAPVSSSGAGQFASPSSKEISIGSPVVVEAQPVSVADGARNIPLTESQRQLWLIAQMGPDASRAYNESITLNLHGQLNLSAIRAAIQKVVNRHEALRTTFHPDGEFQQVHSSLTIEVPLIDFSNSANGQRQSRAADWIAGEAQTPFELDRDQLLRARIIKVDRLHHLLVLTFHHIVVDGWSSGILIGELRSLYEAECRGIDCQLAEPMPYSDYARWESSDEQIARRVAAEAYWLGQFSASVPVLELPVDRPRPAIQTYNGARETNTLDATLCDGLKKLAARNGCTLLMVLLAGYKVLLHRLTGQDDIVVGIPSAGQFAVNGELLFGHCVNMLPLRTRFAAGGTFVTYLSSLKKVLLSAYEHQHYSFIDLVTKMNVPRDRRRSPLFAATFNFGQARSGPGRDFFGLEVDLTSNNTGSSKFDIYLNITEKDGRLLLDLEHNTDLFDTGTIRRWMGHYEMILASLVADPTHSPSEVNLLAASQREQLLVEWNQTQSEYPKDICIHELFEQQVERSPEAIAVVMERGQISYRELDQRANQLAHYLREQGVGPEDRVGVLLERGIEMIVAVLAVLKAGGAYVPLDAKYPQERLDYMLEDAGITILATQRVLANRVGDQQGKVVSVDEQSQEIASRGKEKLESGAGAENLAYVIYTSGSTGKPKGIMVPHRAVSRLVLNSNYVSLEPSDRVAQASNSSFDAATFEIWGALLCGAQLNCVTGDIVLSPTDFAARIREQEISTLFLTTALFNQIARELPAAFQSVRYLLFGGEAVDPGCVKTVLDSGPPKHLLHVYGPTENTTFTTWHSVEYVANDASTIPIGRPISNTQVYVLDALLQPVPVGVTGELHIGGAGLARGYLNNPGLTAEKFIPNPFAEQPGGRMYKTGDLVRLRADGSIEFLGRDDYQVKVRGFRIELDEIEAALREHPDVRETLVLAREEVRGEKQLVAYLVAKPEGAPSITDMRGFLGAKLPDYMVPAAFVILDAFPLTLNGKVDRKALPAPEWARPELDEAYIAPRTPSEELLASIWAEVLRHERVGVHDNFFELGGDSILCIQIVARAHQAGLKLTPKHIFQHQTISELAAVAASGAGIQAEQGLVTGPVTLTPIQHWFFDRKLPDPHHFNQAVLLEVRQPVNPGRLRTAIERLIEHHDALRLRFVESQSGCQQFGAEMADTVAIVPIDLSTLPESEQPRAIETASSKIQASLNLSEGPLLRAALFDLGADRSGRLLIVIHHLIIDGVSWRILLEDLQTICNQLDHQEAIQLPPKTTSFKHWAALLTEYANSPEAEQEADYWSSLSQSPIYKLPVDYSGEGNLKSSAQTISSTLSAVETRALLRDVPRVHGTEINDALLTALARSFAEWTGGGPLLIDLEGHGREEIFSDIDLSRTVGWFTTIFPVLLNIDDTLDRTEALKQTKEQLRRIPHRGIGYGVLRYLNLDSDLKDKMRSLPDAEVSFNYLGQFDQVLREVSPFTLAKEHAGSSYAPHGSRRHSLEVSARVAGSRLRIDWTYSENIHKRDTIERLAESFGKELQKLVADCESTEAKSYTASDLTDFNWSQADLDSITTAIDKSTE